MPKTKSILPAASRLPRIFLLGMVVPVFLLIASLFGFLTWFSIPVLSSDAPPVFTGQWQPEQGCFGILPMITGSAVLAVLTICLSLPVSIGVSGFCLLYPKQKFSYVVKALVRFMTGIPTVVYGLTALMLLVPVLRLWFVDSSGFGLLAALLALSLLTLPVMVMVIENQLAESMKQHELTALALGMNRSEMLTHVVIPAAPKAFATALLLGFGRAIGDTMLPLMLAGNAAQSPESLLDSARTLTAHIGLVMATENGSAEYNSLFVSGLILLTVSVTVTCITRGLEHRLMHRRTPRVHPSMS
ncbi:MAG: ABC transporter permease subunit [Verrucomicrobiae bacterium]|nr:ABC transporter permease subunit [Verrucomicrobiae bacterium]NNJ86610.1 ABC transporter permease subunit [Akkermansiaceae bacterium]